MESPPTKLAGLEKFYEKQKEVHGGSATFLWLIFGVIAFAIEPAARFLSWQAAVYFVIGMFIAAVVFGWIGYGLQRVTAKVFMKTGGSVAAIKSAGVALLVVDAALIYFVARWVVRVLFPVTGDLSIPYRSTLLASAWIIATFTGADGRPVEMTFNNPGVPDMTLAECEAALPAATESVVAAGRQQEPERLGSAKFVGVRCVWSVDDPLKPK